MKPTPEKNHQGDGGKKEPLEGITPVFIRVEFAGMPISCIPSLHLGAQ